MLSFYLIEMRGRKQNRTWLHNVDDYPTDWLHFKMLLEEVMAEVYSRHGKTEAIITLEKHLRGKKFEAFAGYSQKRFPYRREYEAILELEYDSKKPLLQRITVRKAQFRYMLRHVREDYWWLERGIRWKGPPLIPKRLKDPLDPLGMMMEQTALRYADYSRSSKPTYVLKAGVRPVVGYSYKHRTGAYRRADLD